MRGSDDGGRTWTDRGEPIDVYELSVAAAETLLASVNTGSGGTRLLTASTDGGRTWRRLHEALTVDAVPSGSVPVCWARSGEPCTLWSVDPVAGRMAPLRDQPALVPTHDELLPVRWSGRIWVRGSDPVTGRPAVAASADAGRTWSVHVFADAPPCPSEGCLPIYFALGSQTAYVVTVGASARAVYRYTSDGRWERVSGAERVPADRLGAGGPSFVAADGTHVLCETVTQPSGLDGDRFWAARDGTYKPVELRGLPATVYPIKRTQDGWLYTHSYTDQRLYGSTDGWTWSAIAAG
ncbi:hypothetical protein ACFQ1L_27340 [Phytohabitans flavus]|uniref:hypothetical protein n=1 Tax=Phytohabitans flavus TaxID=1076124 RepID=UPI00363D6B10